MRSRRRNRAMEVARRWRATGPNSRLAVGVALVIILWWIGLDTVVVAGVVLPWPIALLVAAIGWARVGLSMRPMLALVVLSVLFDLGYDAPFGSYMIAALTAYGVQAAAESALDMDYDPILQGALPFVSLSAGLLALWVLSSANAGHLARFAPLALAGVATGLCYGLLAPVFHLRVRPGTLSGRG